MPHHSNHLTTNNISVSGANGGRAEHEGVLPLFDGHDRRGQEIRHLCGYPHHAQRRGRRGRISPKPRKQGGSVGRYLAGVFRRFRGEPAGVFLVALFLFFNSRVPGVSFSCGWRDIFFIVDACALMGAFSFYIYIMFVPFHRSRSYLRDVMRRLCLPWIIVCGREYLCTLFEDSSSGPIFFCFGSLRPRHG